MSDIDISVKNFVKINSVFAQLFDRGLYGGKAHINPDLLQELDSVSQETYAAEKGDLKNLERLRDAEKIAKLFDGKMAFQVIMGVEGQTGIHYYMPVRCMEMDALTYSGQCRKISEIAKERKELKKYADGVPKGTKIIPVVTLVFYIGREPWDGPKSVYDMLDVPENMKGLLKETVQDYRMNLFDARHMSYEEIDQFEGDLKAFLLMLKERYDEKRLKTVVAIHRETWYAIGEIKHDKRYKEYLEKERMTGGVDMDAAWDYIEAKGEDKVNMLGVKLTNAGRTDEFIKSLSDKMLQKRLFIEFGLEKEK